MSTESEDRLADSAIDAAHAEPDVDRASESLGAIEKELTTNNARRALARVCIAHAEILLDASARAGITRPTIEWRERALRKAVRAIRIAEDLGIAPPEPLALDALRTHTRALRSIPWHLDRALARALELIAVLERAPFDTRTERAALWHDRGGMTVPWGRGDERARFARSEGEVAEAALRKALALYREVGGRERELAQIVSQLVYLFEMCGAYVGIEELIAELASTLPAVTSASLRAQADLCAEETRTTRAMRALADRLDARVDAPSPPAASPAPEPALSPGSRVTHGKYGPGRVLALHERDIAEVRFDDGSVRKLVARVLGRV